MAGVNTEQFGDYTGMTASEAANAIRKGVFSAETFVEQLIAQDHEWAALNAFISRDHDTLREAAHAADKVRASGAALGPLHGVPLVFKDNIATQAMPTTAGTSALRNYQPKQNAVVAQKLFDAGALLFGKNNMHELAAGITTNNLVYGPTRNPYNQAMIPGGSSGGTAAAISARVAPAGLGTDTGGSLRIPAALCGVCGFRPTTGRYSGEGLVPFSSGTAIAGPMARSVVDLALLDGVITGDTSLPAVQLDKLRIGIAEKFFYDDIDPQVIAAIEAAVVRLRDAGAEVVWTQIDGLEEAQQLGSGMPAPLEALAGYKRFFASSGLTAETYVAQIADEGIRNRLAQQLFNTDNSNRPSATDANTIRAVYRETFERYFAETRLDAMLIPPTPMAARPIGQDETVELNGRQVPTFRTYVRNTAIGSAAGLPCISIPAGMTGDGLPLGIEIDGPPGSDRQLLAIAAAIEAILPRLPAPVVAQSA